MNPLRPIARRTAFPIRRTFVSSSLRLSNPPKLRPEADPEHELQVGELQGAKFRIEPLRRVGEDANTKRARLLCMLTHQSICLK